MPGPSSPFQGLRNHEPNKLLLLGVHSFCGIWLQQQKKKYTAVSRIKEIINHTMKRFSVNFYFIRQPFLCQQPVTGLLKIFSPLQEAGERCECGVGDT